MTVQITACNTSARIQNEMKASRGEGKNKEGARRADKGQTQEKSEGNTKDKRNGAHLEARAS
jgi:hypothetical protein